VDNKPQIIDMLARPRVQKFVLEHENDDERQLLLKYRDIDGVPFQKIADQLRSRRKAKHKMPTWYSASDIVYPPPLHIEQSSSEDTAIFKCSILKERAMSTFSACDLTGGFGVDALHLSRTFREMDFVEKDEMLLRIVEHNFGRLGISNVEWHAARAESFVAQRGIYDLIYVDPSRRDEGQKRVFKLEDCDPDIITLQGELMKKTDNLLVKVSPLLDIQHGLGSIANVKVVYVLSVDNECKELLFLSEKNFTGEPVITTVNLQSAGGFGISSSAVDDRFSFTFGEERSASPSFSKPLTYLYEPNTSLLKAGPFKLISSRFGISKLQSNTHFYTNDSILPRFPGRIFSIVELAKLDSKLAAQFPAGQANVISRNFPLTVDEIRKKTGLREGGDLYLICASGETEKWAMICKRLK
jgi:hypothetical protein